MHRRNDETNEEKEEKESSFPPFQARKKEDDEEQHCLVFLLCFLRTRARKRAKPLKGGTLFLASLRERIFCRFVSTFCFPILLHSHHRYHNTTLEERRGWRKDLEKADLLREDQEDQR
jgi:hypothetical protein